MPLGPYDTWEECIEDNQDKDDPEAYCASLEPDEETARRIDLALKRLGLRTGSTPGDSR